MLGLGWSCLSSWVTWHGVGSGIGFGWVGGGWLFDLQQVLAVASGECLLLAVHHDVFAANGVSRICLERYLEVFGYHVYFASV